ncbi:AP2-like ethylene-responsive transcription factorisoform X1 [Salvia divinorum]|uniref:AP2-like ethylene-responsive transcription factorisoform X1 n=1 Tax=Salvia divinorum TaxID=28513 RepID=A0ABD1FTM7_SALDI
MGSVSTYEKEIIEMDLQSREEYIGSLRMKSSGFSRGVSRYIEELPDAIMMEDEKLESEEFFGNKYLYLGTYGKYQSNKLL